MLLITGIRRGANFIPKVYKNSVYENPIELVVNVDDNGKLLLREERAGEWLDFLITMRYSKRKYAILT